MVPLPPGANRIVTFPSVTGRVKPIMSFFYLPAGEATVDKQVHSGAKLAASLRRKIAGPTSSPTVAIRPSGVSASNLATWSATSGPGSSAWPCNQG